MLPTIKFCKAAHQQQTQQKQQKQQQEQEQQQQEKPAAATTTTAAPATEEGQAPTREKEVEPPGSGEGAAVLAAPVAVVEGKALPGQAVEGAADGDVDGKGPDAPAAGRSACCAEIASAVSVMAVAEAASPPQQVEEQQQGKEEAEADADEVGSEHGDDLSCRVCFEDYEDGDGAFLFRLVWFVCFLLAVSARLSPLTPSHPNDPFRPSKQSNGCCRASTDSTWPVSMRGSCVRGAALYAIPPSWTLWSYRTLGHRIIGAQFSTRFGVVCVAEKGKIGDECLCWPQIAYWSYFLLQPPDQFLAEQGTAVA